MAMRRGLQSKLFDTGKGRLIWSGKDEGGQFYGQKVWSDGRMYRFLLERLRADGIPESGPVINVGAQ